MLSMTVLVPTAIALESITLSADEKGALVAALPDLLAKELEQRGFIPSRSPDDPFDVAMRISIDADRTRDAQTGSLLNFTGAINVKIGGAAAPIDEASMDFYSVFKEELGGVFARRAVDALVFSQRLQTFAIASAGSRANVNPRVPRAKVGRRLAVLDIRPRGTTPTDAMFLSDQLRALAFRALPDVQVITRENILVLLAASGIKIEDCEAACEVETGRRLGADTIISGDLLTIDGRLRLSLRMHDTKTASLTGVATAQGANVDGLDSALSQAVSELLALPKKPAGGK
jgi:hypothetical protein